MRKIKSLASWAKWSKGQLLIDLPGYRWGRQKTLKQIKTGTSLDCKLVCFCFPGYLQACRGLMIAAVCLGFFGSLFALVGMKCTKIGGSDQNKAKIACLAGIDFILSGESKRSVCVSLFGNELLFSCLVCFRSLFTFCLFPLCSPDNLGVFWPDVCGSEVSIIISFWMFVEQFELSSSRKPCFIWSICSFLIKLTLQLLWENMKKIMIFLWMMHQ